MKRRLIDQAIISAVAELMITVDRGEALCPSYELL